jgi:hypothetical protein
MKCYFENMNCHRVKLRTIFTLTLLLLLSIQLTGLTCLQDFQAHGFFRDRPVSVDNHSGTVTTSPLDDDSLPPSQQQFHHDCPCHYVVASLASFTLASAPYSGAVAVPVSLSVLNNLPQAIFRPPLFLL